MIVTDTSDSGDRSRENRLKTGHLGTEATAARAPIAKVGRIDTTSAAPAAPSTGVQRTSSRWRPRCCSSRASPRAWPGRTWSPTARTSSTCTSTSAGAAALDHPGTLYSYVYADQTPDFPLPFTYPPFAAIVFYPLHLLPFGLVALGWQLATIAALYGAVRISQRLLGVPAGAHGRRVAMVWTAVTI